MLACQNSKRSRLMSLSLFNLNSEIVGYVKITRGNEDEEGPNGKRK